eukprot:COSAG02_NODE_42968_length_379_cov_0.935714_1_plen_34_part_10
MLTVPIHSIAVCPAAAYNAVEKGRTQPFRPAGAC